MRKLVALLLAIIMVFSLVACGAADNSSSEPIEDNSSSKVEETANPQDTLLWSKTVAFDENNEINFYVNKEEPNKLYGLFSFDGIDPSIEYTRAMCAVAVATEYGFGQNLFFAIISGENLGTLSFGALYKWELPATYIEGDASVQDNAFEVIRGALKEFAAR